LTVNDYLERLIAVRELKISEEEWMTCSICGARLKAENTSEQTYKVHSRRLLMVN
jgi:hypothetical protein